MHNWGRRPYPRNSLTVAYSLAEGNICLQAPFRTGILPDQQIIRAEVHEHDLHDECRYAGMFSSFLGGGADAFRLRRIQGSWRLEQIDVQPVVECLVALRNRRR